MDRYVNLLVNCENIRVFSWRLMFQYSHNCGTVTIASKMNSVVSPERHPSTEDMDIFENSTIRIK